MRTAIVNVVAILAATPAMAAWPIEPPAKYDFPYPGSVEISTFQTLDGAYRACAALGAPMGSVGCAQARLGTCYIIVPEAKLVAKWGSHEMLLRHEQAHCNGWNKDHRKD